MKNYKKIFIYIYIYIYIYIHNLSFQIEKNKNIYNLIKYTYKIFQLILSLKNGHKKNIYFYIYFILTYSKVYKT